MDGVSFHDFAADVAAVIRAEGGAPAILAGHAYGNWIARTVAADFPELARGVVLVAAGAKSMPRELTDTITMINDPAAPEAERSEERRVGKECVSTCRSRWSPYH